VKKFFEIATGVVALLTMGALLFGGVSFMNEFYANKIDELDSFLELKADIKASEGDSAATTHMMYESISDTRELEPAEERYSEYHKTRSMQKRDEVIQIEQQRMELKK